MEIKQILEDQAKNFEDFKEANELRLKAIEEKGHVPADLQEKLAKIDADFIELREEYTEGIKQAKSFSIPKEGQPTEEQVAHAKKFKEFLRVGDDSGLKEMQQKAMNTLSDPDGGYLVLPEMDLAIDRVVPTVSAIGRLAKQVTIGSNKWLKNVKTAGMTMARVDDGGTDGETTAPQYARLEIEVFTAEVEPWVFNETLEDAYIDLAADLTDEAAIGFGEGLGSEYAIGNGVGKARGITAYTTVANASYAWGSVGYIPSTAAGAFATSAPADDLISLQHSLKQQYRPGAVFLMADSTLATARQMKDGSGSYYLWQPDPLAGFGGRFLGSPVEIDDNMPVIAANSLSIAYGNIPRAYAVVNRAGTTLIRDPYTAKGKTKFNFRRRSGGGIYNFEAIKLMKFAAS